jgi:8-oxo-dGTP pyrophosphatase MutT (NUDIX family)
MCVLPFAAYFAFHFYQVAFPGGKSDPGETQLETARRETKEEIGLDLSEENYALLGRLSDLGVSYVTRTGEQVTLSVGCFGESFLCV